MAHGRYTILGKLADGGMAEIFLAVQHGAEGFQKRVVLKRVLSAFSADPQFRNMILDEAHISMSLAHGNIVQMLDLGLAGGRAFLVLELVDGWDLEQVLDRAGLVAPAHPWPPSLSLYVAGEICRALAYAHAKRGPDDRPLGIVHRDVSPNNVLLSAEGEVKLADFGIAKAERKRERTAAGIIKGKMGFMSPEQARGLTLDARSDLYSLGTVLYLMLTGRRPFEAGSELESLMRAQRGEYPPPDELNPHLSAATVAIVKRAMTADPEARYQSGDEMLRDIERVLRAEYRSAGRTELVTWLAQLGKLDGVPSIGRMPLATGLPGAAASGARPARVAGPGLAGGQSVPVAAGVQHSAPTVVDATSELSAGTAVELSDFDRDIGAELTLEDGPGASQVGAFPAHYAPTMAAVTPPGIGVSGGGSGRGQTTPPPSGGVAARPSGHALAAGATPMTASQSGGTLAPRPSKRGRLGFVLGALFMLGAVVGAKWLVGWLGSKPQIEQLLRKAADSAAATSSGAGGAAGGTPAPNAGTADNAAPASGTATGAAAVDAAGTTAASGATTPGAGGATGGGVAGPATDAGATVVAALGADGTEPAGAGGAPGGTGPATDGEDDDEDRLIEKVAARKGAAVIVEDEAENDDGTPAAGHRATRRPARPKPRSARRPGARPPGTRPARPPPPPPPHRDKGPDQEGRGVGQREVISTPPGAVCEPRSRSSVARRYPRASTPATPTS